MIKVRAFADGSFEIEGHDVNDVIEVMREFATVGAEITLFSNTNGNNEQCPQCGSTVIEPTTTFEELICENGHLFPFSEEEDD